MADDVAINFEKMSLWTREQATAYFESGGQDEPPPPIREATALFTNGSRPTSPTPWLSCLEKKPAALFRCVVFGWTGNRGGQGSAHNIRRSPLNWSQEVGPDVEIWELSLPGRGTRIKEPLRESASELVAELADSLCALATSARTLCVPGVRIRTLNLSPSLI